MRKINLIVVHCTATPAGRGVTVADVDRWHRMRGFTGIGYHYLVGLDGEVFEGRPVEQVGAHALGYNATSLGVAYVGGCDRDGKPADTRTPEQRRALRLLLKKLKAEYPQAKITGHNRLAPKACPCFNADEEYADI